MFFFLRWIYLNITGKRLQETMNRRSSNQISLINQISNLESGDAFCVLPSGVGQDGLPLFLLMVLQITVRENHHVKVNGLHDIILAYPEFIQQIMMKKLLVFVTPLYGWMGVKLCSEITPYIQMLELFE